MESEKRWYKMSSAESELHYAYYQYAADISHAALLITAFILCLWDLMGDTHYIADCVGAL